MTNKITSESIMCFAILLPISLLLFGCDNTIKAPALPGSTATAKAGQITQPDNKNNQTNTQSAPCQLPDDHTSNTESALREYNQAVHESYAKVPIKEEIIRTIELYNKLQARSKIEKKHYYGTREGFADFTEYVSKHSTENNAASIFEEYVKQHPLLCVADELYYALGKHYFSVGKFQEAYSTFNTVITKYNYSHILQEEEIALFGKELADLKTIEEKYKVENDERLWFLGQIHWKISQKSWNQGEVWWHDDLPVSLLEKLINEYPNSKWADNAEYVMIERQQGSSQEGGDTSSNLILANLYETFIAKYPESELIPNARERIVQLYEGLNPFKEYDDHNSICYINTPDEDLKVLKKSKRRAETVIAKASGLQEKNEAVELLKIIKTLEDALDNNCKINSSLP